MLRVWRFWRRSRSVSWVSLPQLSDYNPIGFRAGFARSVTAVVGVDDDAQSMVTAIAKTPGKDSTLVLMTTYPDNPVIQECRTLGARILPVDFNRPETVGMRRLWRRLDRLYLLSSDPSTNLARLRVISQRLEEVGSKRRIPLIVRIDDPWLAKAWRAEQLGGSDTVGRPMRSGSTK